MATPSGTVTEKRYCNLLIELFGEFNNLRGQRHAGLHHDQVSSAGSVSLPLGALGGPLPLLVLDGHVGAVLHQSLDSHTHTLTVTSLSSG